MTSHLIKLEELLPAIKARVLTGSAQTDIGGCYISDLLSDVLARAQPGMLWVTIQTHRNVISVAATKDVTAVLFTCGRRLEPDVVAEAKQEGITLLATPLTTFEAAAKLWEAGLRE
jgi:predicted transcriptional regulator